jgi:hypothetical protein
LSALAAPGGRPSLPVVGAVLAAVLVLAAGCASHGTGETPAASAAGMSPPQAVGHTGSKAAARPAAGDQDFAASGGAGSQVQQRQVISTGHISLTSGDVSQTRDRLDGVLVREHGQIADEDTTTDDHGRVNHARLVVRVPGARFDETMTALSHIASLRSAQRQAQDVTTRVIDLEARISAERAGVRRLERLISQTANLRALLAVERALTQRQGELESLQQQRAYLVDQTSLATITLDIALTTPTPAPPEHAAGGFVGGLSHGWNALVAVITAVLVALGAFLPFAAAAVVVGVPAWIVARRTRRSRRVRAAAES